MGDGESARHFEAMVLGRGSAGGQDGDGYRVLLLDLGLELPLASDLGLKPGQCVSLRVAKCDPRARSLSLALVSPHLQ